MTFYRCDRCGKEMKRDESAIFHIELYRKGEHYLDLCPSCYEAFKMFVRLVAQKEGET